MVCEMRPLGFLTVLAVENVIINSIANSLIQTPNWKSFMGKLGFDEQSTKEAALALTRISHA